MSVPALCHFPPGPLPQCCATDLLLGRTVGSGGAGRWSGAWAVLTSRALPG